MGQYIDLCKVKFIGGKFFDEDDDALIFVRDVRRALLMTPVEDVVPREEVDKLEYTLLGVMHSVDKWLDGGELEQDEVNRAITMREKTLRIIETIKTDTAKAIFEEIDEGFDKIAIVATNDPEYCGFDGVCRQVFEAVDDVLAALKKKYLEVSK